MARRTSFSLAFLAAFLAACCWRSALRLAFTLGASLVPSRRAAGSAVARRIDIFEGIQFPNIQGDLLSGESNWDGDRSAREADESISRVVECNMPLGVRFEENSNGDIYIKDVDSSSDAFSQAVRPGAQLTMISATFGDEMWNTKGVGMRQFMTVLNSRFGPTIKLALEKENKKAIDEFFASLQPEESGGEKKDIKELMMEFEMSENDLAGKSLWNPFW